MTSRPLSVPLNKGKGINEKTSSRPPHQVNYYCPFHKESGTEIPQLDRGEKEKYRSTRLAKDVHTGVSIIITPTVVLNIKMEVF